MFVLLKDFIMIFRFLAHRTCALPFRFCKHNKPTKAILAGKFYVTTDFVKAFVFSTINICMTYIHFKLSLSLSFGQRDNSTLYHMLLHTFAYPWAKHLGIIGYAEVGYFGQTVYDKKRKRATGLHGASSTFRGHEQRTLWCTIQST